MLPNIKKSIILTYIKELEKEYLEWTSDQLETLEVVSVLLRSSSAESENEKSSSIPENSNWLPDKI